MATVTNYTCQQIHKELKDLGIEDSLVGGKLTSYSHTKFLCAVIVVLNCGALFIAGSLAYTALTGSPSMATVGIPIFIGSMSLIAFVGMGIYMRHEYRAIHKPLSASERDKLLKKERMHLQECMRQEEAEAAFYQSVGREKQAPLSELRHQLEAVGKLLKQK